MIQSYVRSAVVCCGVIGAVLSTPAESQAIFHWFGKCCQPQTTYAPIQPAVNCNPCASQVAQYVPTTCYRQECVSVPVTVMQPVTSCSMAQCNPCNPCSWCPTQTTTLRPVTVMQQQVRMVPYTTYRIVYTQPSPCATGCATAMPATSTYYQPSTPTMMSAPAPAMPSTGSCCGGGAAPASYSAPATTYSAPAMQQPAYSTPAPSLSSPPATSAPATTTPPTSTYESGRPATPSTTDPSAPLSPIPQSSSSSSGATFGPSLAPPASSRTTSAPVQRAWMVRPVSNAAPADVPAWLQTQRATPTTSANANSVADDWRPSVR